MIRVGAATEVEMKEKKARVEDAMHATRAAVEEGVVPGGGVALIRSSAVLDGLKADDEEKVGVSIVKRAIEEPLRWIAQNAGWEGSVVLDKVRQNKGAFGFNAADEEYEDLMKAGSHRSDQGRADRAAERRVGRWIVADHRSDGDREARREEARRGASRSRVLSDGFPRATNAAPDSIGRGVRALRRGCKREHRA